MTALAIRPTAASVLDPGVSAGGAASENIWHSVGNGVFSSGEGAAFAAWHEAVAHPGDPISLVRAAVLAANNHNTQPWRFTVEATAIDLFADLDRATGTLDPMLREMYISLGAALENLEIAAGPNGFTTRTALFPTASDSTHIAHIALTPATPAGSALFDAIPNRRTNRMAFHASRQLADAFLGELHAMNDDDRIELIWLTSQADRTAFGNLTIQATEAIIADEQQSNDNFAWFRGNWGELQQARDGLTIDSSGLSSLMRAIVKLIPVTTESRFGQSWLKMTKHPQLDTAPVFGIILTRNEPALHDFVSAGRFYQRIDLQATVRGLALQPLNQIPERIDRETALGRQSKLKSELATLLDIPDAVALMPFRIGYPAAAGALSPRRTAEQTIHNGAAS